VHINFQPVSSERWSDFEMLFECKGSPHNCWCTAWRKVKKTSGNPNKEDKKSLMKEKIYDDIPVGIIAYLDEEPIAWCSIAPRETYKPLGGDESLIDVWSLVCFFVKRPFRNRGIANQLLSEAIRYATESGAKYVEAYPVEPDSPSYRFMGFIQTFEKAKFKFVKKAGTRRNIMLLQLSDGNA